MVYSVNTDVALFVTMTLLEFFVLYITGRWIVSLETGDKMFYDGS